MSPPHRAKPPVLMAHGAFCGGWAFDQFRAPFERAGHPVDAPDLPAHGHSAAAQAVAGLSIGDYVEALARQCALCAAPPVLLGHSMGGLLAQLVAARTPLSALILIAPSPAWGAPIASAEEAAAAFGLAALGPVWNTAVEPHWPSAQAHLFARLAVDEQRAAFARLGPESGRALSQILNWWLDPTLATLVRAEAITCPVLTIAGGGDAIHPAGAVRTTARRLGARFETFSEMGHWIIGEPGWPAVARTCLDWIASLTPAQINA